MISSIELDQMFIEYGAAVDGNISKSAVSVTPERIDENFENFGKAMEFFMYYPDVFLDTITPSNSSLKLFPFQRISLRAKMRKRQVYETMTRGASKSWLAIASRYLTCMFVPGHTSFVVTDVKEQAVAIAKEKIQDDLWVKYPLLANEMKPFVLPGGGRRTPVNSGKGYASYRFTTGASFDVVGVDSARGKRRHSGIIEEVIEQDQTKVNEKIIPLMNISRRTSLGKLNVNEPFNAQKIYVTSAGYMGTFAYEMLIETLLKSVLYPEDYIALVLDYRIPLMHGLLDIKTIREIKASPSFGTDSFDREYGSIWSGEMKGAAISTGAVLKTRVVKRADYKPRENIDTEHGEGFYVMGADMAKDGSANTAVSIIRVTPAASSFRYVVVNGFIASSSDYEVVSNEMKRAAMRYNVKLMVIDTNGIGAAIRDWLNKPSIDKMTGEELPGYGVINPPKDSGKDLVKYRQNNIIYEIKANGQSASAINWFFFSRVKSGSFKMLISHRQAIDSLSKNSNFIYQSVQKQQKILQPFQFCDMLEAELVNLDIEETNTGSGSLMRLKRRNNSVQKDLFSSVSYAMYGVHQHLELPFYQSKLRKRRSLADFVMIGGNS